MKMITKTSDYSVAAFEYAGMVSYSYMKRGALALKFGIIKIGQPVKRVASVPLDYCTQQMDKLGKVFNRKNEIEERLIAIDDKLERIIRRLADIEKSGVVVAEKQKLGKEKKQIIEKKQINEGNKMFFKAIADENIQLRHQQEGNQ
ncbi:MAG: hypothetical protein WCR46_04185 [Deltaproteobacteria bacterium]